MLLLSNIMFLICLSDIFVNDSFKLTFVDPTDLFKGFSVVLILLAIVVLIVQIFKERTKEMAMMRLHGVAYFKIWLTVLFEMMFSLGAKMM